MFFCCFFGGQGELPHSTGDATFISKLTFSWFCFIIQKTVLAVLDKLINPHWPYLPQSREDDENQDEIECVLSSVPDDPMNYDFFYHILEADNNGRQPKIEVAIEVDEHGTPIKTQTRPNPKFNHMSRSCLRRIAESGNKVCVKVWTAVFYLRLSTGQIWLTSTGLTICNNNNKKL